MNEPRNPFILGHRIERPYFCDRYEDQKRLTSSILNGRNVVLMSERRMGKTSLAYLSLHDSQIITDEYITILLDILQTNSISEFTYIFGKAVFDALRSKGENIVREFIAAISSLKGSFGYDPLNGTPTFDIQLGDIRHPQFTLEEIFKFIESYKKPVLVMIDEFQQITKYREKNAEAILRSYIQHLSNATFIFAGSEQTILSKMFASSRRPFYNSSDIMHLNPIDEEIYVEFAVRMFEIRKRSIDAESVKWVFSLFGGNTFYLQRTMNGAFEETEEGDQCRQDTILRTVKSMLAANEIVYRQILSNVATSVKPTLLAIAKEKSVKNPMSADFINRNALSSSSNVQYAIKQLLKHQLIIRKKDSYSLTDPLLRIFVNSIYGTPEF